MSAVFLGAGLVVFLLYEGVIRFNYPSLEEFPIQGVDVSHHQREIDWPRLKGAGVQFAYIKASEGGDFRDPRFRANWNEAIRAGVVPGAYHFYTLCKTGRDQAKNFLGALAGVEGSGLPPAVDLEFGGNCARRPSLEEFAEQLQSFLQELEEMSGCAPVLYVTQEFYYPYVAGRFRGVRLWVRDIYMRPRLKDGAAWPIWQFANRGRMDGVDTFIDLNAFRGSRADFEEFRCGTDSRPWRRRGAYG